MDRVELTSEGRAIKVLSLHQPYASAVAAGLKRVETRSWAPPERLLGGERFAVHAAKRPPRDGECPAGKIAVDGLGTPMFWLDEPFTEEDQEAAGVDADGTLHAFPMPLGEIVATATVRGAFRTEWFTFDGARYSWRTDVGLTVPPREQLWGDYTHGRWGWLLSDVRAVWPPVPFRGGQGLSREWTP